MGRVSRGVRGIRLRSGDRVIGMDIVEEGSSIFVISQYGYGKRTKVSQFTPHARGGVGIRSAVVNKKTGDLIGEALLFFRSREHALGEIGYMFHPDHAGHGYATEAARVMLRLGFEEYGLHRIVGRLDARNTASARVLERLGMRREAHFRQNEIIEGERTDEFVYAILRAEWQERARA